MQVRDVAWRTVCDTDAKRGIHNLRKAAGTITAKPTELYKSKCCEIACVCLLHKCHGGRLQPAL